MANTAVPTNFHIIGQERNSNSNSTPMQSLSSSSSSTTAVAQGSFNPITNSFSTPPHTPYQGPPRQSPSSLLLLQQQQQPQPQKKQNPGVPPPLPPPIVASQAEKPKKVSKKSSIPPSTAPPKLSPATRSATSIGAYVRNPFSINTFGYSNQEDDDDDDNYGANSERIPRVFDGNSSSIFPDMKNDSDDVISDVIDDDTQANIKIPDNNNNGRIGKKQALTSMSVMNLPSEGGTRQFDRAYLYRNSSVNDLRRLENLSCMLGQAESVGDDDGSDVNDDGYSDVTSGVAHENSESGCARPRGFLAGGRSLSGSSIASLGSNNSNKHEKFKAQCVVYKKDDNGGDGNSRPKIYRERYVIGRVIGEGSYAKVKEAFDLNNHCTVAIKIFSLRKLRRIPLGESSMNRELRTFRKLVPHHSVVSLVDYWRDDTKDKNYLAMTYAPCGTLKSLIDRAPDRKIPLPQARRLFLCIVEGLAHLHRQGIYHRDLKIDNFMLLSEYRLCITDFGTATFDTTTEGIGAPAFQPPEVALTGRAPSSAKLDIWAAGITLFMMVTGKYPFDDSGTVYQLFEDIGRCDIAFPDDLPSDLLSLLRGMLKPDPSQRLSLDEIAKSRWVNTKEDCVLPVPAPKIRTVFTSEYVRQLVNPDGVSLLDGNDPTSGPGDISTLLDDSKKKNSKCCIIL